MYKKERNILKQTSNIQSLLFVTTNKHHEDIHCACFDCW